MNSKYAEPQDVLPGTYVVLLRHSRKGRPFSVTVEAQGTVVKESVDIPATDPAAQTAPVWGRGRSEFGEEPVWEQIELWKVRTEGRPQACHVKLHNSDSNSSKDGWALDYLELRRIIA